MNTSSKTNNNSQQDSPSSKCARRGCNSITTAKLQDAEHGEEETHKKRTKQDTKTKYIFWMDSVMEHIFKFLKFNEIIKMRRLSKYHSKTFWFNFVCYLIYTNDEYGIT